MSERRRAAGREGVPEEVHELRQFFRALGDTSRLRIVRELAGQEEMSVSQLVAALRVSQPLVSWHLGHLRRIGLVRMRRTGRQGYCSLDRAQLRHYQAILASFLGENEDSG